MKTLPPFSRPELLIAFLACTLMGLSLVAAAAPLTLQEKRFHAMRNCVKTGMVLRMYAADHDGKYPDSAANVRTANEAFRELLKSFLISDEFMFGCPDSQFNPDNKIGDSPDFDEALRAGENHWALTAGLTDGDDVDIPLFFENPAKADWPPKWLYWNGEKRGRSRAWRDGSVIVAFTGGAVRPVKLVPASDGFPEMLLAGPENGADLFDSGKPRKILDIEVVSGKE